jgi:hypothetical protein
MLGVCFRKYKFHESAQVDDEALINKTKNLHDIYQEASLYMEI